MTISTTSRVFISAFRVRSYELDGLGHVNHAVYLNYLEQARYDSLAAGGFEPRAMAARGWAVHVARVEVDYRRECRFGDLLLVRTSVAEFRHSSMILEQSLFRMPPSAGPPDHEAVGAERPAPPEDSPGIEGAAQGPWRFAGLRPEWAEPVATELTPELRATLGEGELAVEARIVAVWIGPDGRPMRIPPEARRSLQPAASSGTASPGEPPRDDD